MYKIMILLNTFSSEIGWPISTKFHVNPTVEMGVRVCSNCHPPLTVIPEYGKIGKIMIIKKTQKTKKHSSSSKSRTAQMMFLSLVAMTGMDKCCITSAYLQWLFHSVEQAVAHESHVFFLSFLILILTMF